MGPRNLLSVETCWLIAVRRIWKSKLFQEMSCTKGSWKTPAAANEHTSKSSGAENLALSAYYASQHLFVDDDWLSGSLPRSRIQTSNSQVWVKFVQARKGSFAVGPSASRHPFEHWRALASRLLVSEPQRQYDGFNILLTHVTRAPMLQV